MRRAWAGVMAVGVWACSPVPSPAPDGGTTPEDLPPTVSPVTLTTVEDTALEFRLDARDPEGQPLGYDLVQPRLGLLIRRGTTFRYEPALHFHGTETFAVGVSDGTSRVEAAVAITVTPVNDAPAAGLDIFRRPLAAVLEFSVAELLANDRDPEGDVLSVTKVELSNVGTLSLDAGVITLDLSSGVPDTSVSFFYDVSDGALTSRGRVAVNIERPPNRSPSPRDDELVVLEDTSLTVPFDRLTRNDLDLDFDQLTIVDVKTVPSDSVAIVGATIVYTPYANFSGTRQIDYLVWDGEAGAWGRAFVTVSPVDDAPMVSDNTWTIEEDDPNPTFLGWQFTNNDWEPDGEELRLVSLSNVTGGAGVTLLHAGTVDHRVQLTLPPEYSGRVEFDVGVSDGNSVVTSHATVNVTPVDDRPRAYADTFTVVEDGVLQLMAADLLANDIDVDSTLTVTSVNASGSVATLSGTDITFTPYPDFAGTALFTYQVTDGTSTTSGFVTVNVTPVPDLPRPTGDTLYTRFNVALTVPETTLLQNDVDPDAQNAVGTLSIVSVDRALCGTVQRAGGNVYFVPSGTTGVCGFDYTVANGAGTATAHVVVNVAP